MAWPGYWLWGGTEIINVARTQAYARIAGASWLRPVYDGDVLQTMLAQNYQSTIADPAPWADSADPPTLEFLGCYPLDISGVDDSTGTATVVEGVLDGGVIGTLRRSTRTMVFSLALIGMTEGGCEAGMRWLKQVLNTTQCSSIWPCSAQNVCFLAYEPCIDLMVCEPGEPVRCLDVYQRQFYDAAVITGPTVTSKQRISTGGAVWTVQFTAVAGNPFTYGPETDVVRQFMLSSSPYVNPDHTGPFSQMPHNRTDVDCPGLITRPLVDPDCPLVIPPPSLPGIPLNCYNFPVNYARQFFTIPKELVAIWGETVPRFTIHTYDAEPGPIRVRFYPEEDLPDGDTTDPCNYCGDLTIGYLPADTVLMIDGTVGRTYVQIGDQGVTKRADGVIYGTDGAPFMWPILTCGSGYLVTVDTLRAVPNISMDLSISGRAL